ncbi:MAG: hypothetical protein PVH29_01185 [Candidatus Zixiibacteriota bacterium]|jgi:hypothetical protein
MKFAIGPPWLRIAFSPGDDRVAGMLRAIFAHARPGEENGDGPELAVVRTAEAGEEEGWAALEGDVFRAGRNSAAAWYDFSESRGEVTLSPQNGAFVENFVRQVFIWESYRRGGLVLHSAAFAMEGDVVVSCGESNSGKSTLSRILKERVQVYSDEMNVVDGEGRVWGLPFLGTGVDRVQVGGGKLRALTFHRPGDDFRATALAPADVARHLWPNVFVPEAIDTALRETVFDLAAAVAARTAGFTVEIPLEESVTYAGFRNLIKAAALRKEGQHEA